jgi:arginyl-tRNA synthetase
MFEDQVLALIRKHVPEAAALEVPPDPQLGDYAFPCFTLAKTLRKAPPLIAKELAGKLSADFLEKVVATGPYVNFFLKTSALARETLAAVARQRAKFGTSRDGAGKTIALEYSSPNIGKPFHFGHLRSTVIGHALGRLYASQGYAVVRLNHLGDWGTQFGKLIHAYLTWGDKKKLAASPVEHLLELYVKFNEEAAKDPKLDDEARAWFRKLEDGDGQATKLWAKFRHDSLDEFRDIYRLFGIEFDSYDGESFYTDKMDAAVVECERKGLAQASEGALVVPIAGVEAPLMLRKSDGASTYAARDLAALLYRIKTYKPHRLVYIVGREQGLHFHQLFRLAHMLGHPQERFLHIDFGLYLSPEGGKMATRKGKAVLMRDVLDEAVALARKTIEEKNPSLEGKDEMARAVAVGAIFFGDLINDRNKDVIFDLGRILDFEGDTGPYLQYTHARARSILAKAKTQKVNLPAKPAYDALTEPSERRVLILLSRYPAAVRDALKQHKPHILAQHLIELGRAFNEFYHACPCISEPDGRKRGARLALVDCAAQVVANGLGLLGITAPEEM